MLKVFSNAVLAGVFASVLTTFSTHQVQAGDGPLPVAASLGVSVVLDPTDGIDWTAGEGLIPAWSWETQPGTSVADFSDATALRPSFTPDVNGTWVARLDLFDAADPAVLVSTVFLDISTENTAPVARIRARGMPGGASPLTLDGTPSFDVDGDALSYGWSLVSAPTGHAAGFSATDGPFTDFAFDLPGTYVVGLTVQDDSGLNSEMATYEIDLSGAADLDLEATLSTFNLVTNLYSGNQEVEGRTFIGSNVQGVTGQFGYDPAQDGTGFAELYIDGDLTNSTINLTPGDEARISGTASNTNVNNGTLVENATDLPAFDFQVFRDQSAFLANLTGEPADLSDQNNKRFGGAPNAVAGEADFGPNTRIVEVALQDLQSGGYSIDVSQADTVIINVSGTSGTFQMNPLGGTGFAGNVLWNFYEATNINVNAVLAGHVLAPYARMSGFAGSGEGTVIADEVQLTNGELHQQPWAGEVPAATGQTGSARAVTPVADLRFDQISGAVGEAILIESFASTDIDGGPLVPTLDLISAPAGSVPTLVTDADGIATFTADQPGEYLVGLSVDDGGRIGHDQLLISVGGGNLRPVARIDDLRDAAVGAVSTLDGSQSFDLDGDLLNYRWALLSAPSGSTATLGDASSPLATLTPDVAGLYVVQLTANDGTVDGVPATRAIVVGAPLPEANAGLDAVPDANGEALLDGGLSNATAPAYTWSLLGGNGTLDDATLAASLLTLPAATTEVAQLIIADANGISLPDTVFIGDTALRPVLFRASVTQSGGAPVQLSAPAQSQDANGDALTYAWSLLHRPTGSTATIDPDPSVAKASGDTLSFTGDIPGLYLIQLEASDSAFAAEPVVIALTILNDPPVASALTPADTFVGDTATLDGSASFDPNGDALTYVWTVVSAPTGSTVTITDASSAIASFTPDVRGSYTFQLEVADFETSDTVQVTLTVPNRAPLAALDGPTEVAPGEEVSYSALGSTDPDGDALSFSFELVSSPAGSSPVLVDLAPGETGFATDLAGDYVLQVTVSDGLLSATETIQVAVQALNAPPVLGEIRDLYTVELGLEFALDMTGSDPDGDDITFFATPLPLASGITLNAQNGEVRFRPEAGQTGSYSFTVGVSDGALTDTAILNIEVVPGTASDTSVYGRVLDAADFANGVETPLANMPVRLRDAALMTVTNPDGTFDFGSLTAGLDQVIIEPSAAGGPGGYLGTVRPISITENQNRDLSPDFLLTPLNEGCAQVVSGVATVLTGTNSGVTVTIAADTIRESGGALYTGNVCLAALPQLSDVPGLPDGTQACNVYGVEAAGASFTQGVSISAPNVDQLPEQTRLRLLKQSTVSGAFQTAGNAFVDPGAATVSSTVGGFDQSTLFTFLPQAPRSVASADQPTGNRMLTPFEGDLNEVYTLPGYFAFNQAQQVGLSYHSQAANPTIIVAGDVTIANDASLPVTLSGALNIGGLSLSDTNQWTPREGLNGQTPALVGEEVTLRQSIPVDGSGLDSGRYGYSYQSQAKYACSTVSSQHNAELYVQNEIQSPYGNGWSIDGLQKLTVSPDGKVAIIDDDGISTFDPKPTLTEFVDEPLVFPAVGPTGLGTLDLDNDGDLEVVFADSGTGSIGLISNFGNGEFQLETPLIVGDPNDVGQTGSFVPNLAALSVGELTNDGLDDVAYALQRQQGYGIAESDGFGGLVQGFEDLGIKRRALDIVVADIDEDGFEDIIYGANTGFFSFINDEIWASYGGVTSRTLSRISYRGFSGRGTLQVEVGDVDGDGRTDVAYRTREGVDFVFNSGNRSYSLSVLRAGNGGYNFLGNYFQMADFNDDGRLDLVYSSSSQLQILLNTTGRAFAAPVMLPRPPGAGAGLPVNLGDANGDGYVDLVVTSGSELFVYLSNGDGTFQPFETGLVDYPVTITDIADMNGDGSLDLVSLQRFSVTIHFSEPSASGEFVAGAGEFSQLTRLPDGTYERRYKDGIVVVFDANGLQTAMVDRQGNRTEFAYDADGRLATKTDQVGGVTSFAYGPDGRMANITYPDGRVTEFAYDDVGNLNKVTEPTGSQVSFAYDENGRLINTTNQNGNNTLYTYDAVGNFTGGTLPDGSSISHQIASSLGLVDGLGGLSTQPLVYVKPEDRITTVTSKTGEVTEIEVNQFGSIVRILDPYGRRTLIERDDQNLVTRVERPFQDVPGGKRVDTVEYDSRGNVLEYREAVGTSFERVSSYVYEPTYNRPLQITLPGGIVTQYEYDAFGQITKMTDAEGGERTSIYTPEGKLERETNENGNTFEYTYDGDLNLSGITFPNGNTIDHSYDAYGNIVETIEAAGTALERRRVYDFDALNRPLEKTDALQESVLMTYDAGGNQIGFEDSLGRSSSATFDIMDRAVGGTDPMTGTTSIIYDVIGVETKFTDGLGATDIVRYDTNGRIAERAEPHNVVRKYEHNLIGQISKLTDGKGGEINLEYDVFGRATMRREATGEISTAVFDARDLMVQVVSPTGDEFTYSYDELERLTEIQTPDNTISMSYDPVGNLTGVTDNDTTVTMTYDESERVETVTYDYPGLPDLVTLIYEYDVLGRRVRTTDSFGGVAEFQYDLENRLTQITAPWTGTLNMTYSADGRLVSRAFSNGSQTSVVFDTTSARLSEFSNTLNGTLVNGDAFEYDASGRVNIVRNLADINLSKSLAYDAGRRLVDVSQGMPILDGGTPISIENYEYDAEDNRTVSHLSSANQYDARHQLLGNSEATFTYDANGNRLTRTDLDTGEVITYSWDAQDLLVGLTSNEGWSVNYRYDGQQRRVGKSYTASNGKVTDTAYVLDGPNVLFSFTTTDGVTTARRWLNVIGLDNLFAFEEYPSATATAGTGTVYEVHQDYLGSVVAVSSHATGTIEARYSYDSFGIRTTEFGTIEPGFGFTGQQFDPETDLHYFRTRYYESREGRFLSMDPLGFPDGIWNAYVYALNSPYQFTDPTGLTISPSFSKLTLDQTMMGRENPPLFQGVVVNALLAAFNRALDALYAGDIGFGFPGVSSLDTPVRDPQRFSNCHPIDPKKATAVMNIFRPHPNIPDNGHARAIQERILFLYALNGWHKQPYRYNSIVSNQAQRNAAGQMVSTCQPDLQYNFFALHYLEEYMRPWNTLQEFNKMLIMNRADPLAAQVPVALGSGRRK